MQLFFIPESWENYYYFTLQMGNPGAGKRMFCFSYRVCPRWKLNRKDAADIWGTGQKATIMEESLLLKECPLSQVFTVDPDCNYLSPRGHMCLQRPRKAGNSIITPFWWCYLDMFEIGRNPLLALVGLMSWRTRCADYYLNTWWYQVGVLERVVDRIPSS